MKHLILVGLILQLVIIIIEINGEYEFGDIIAFPRKCLSKKAKPLYKHYAVYVGPNTAIDIGQGDNDIFHRTGKRKGKPSDCQFGKLEKTRGKWKNERKDNYLDGIEGFNPGTKDHIKERITEISRQCHKYEVFANNCEHLATFVRYDLSLSLQRGTVAEFIFNLLKINSAKVRDILDRVKEDMEEEDTCESVANDASKPLSYQSVVLNKSCQLTVFYTVICSHNMTVTEFKRETFTCFYYWNE